MSALLIAEFTILEARRRKLLWIVVGLGLVFLALFATGFHFMHRDFAQRMRIGSQTFFQASNTLLLVGLYVVNFFLVMLAVLTSADTIAGEIASGTMQTIVTKPLRRWEVVLGKWLGLAVMLCLFGLAMSAGLMAIVWLIADYLPPDPVRGVGLMLLGGLVVLTISIAGGTRLSTIANGVVAFMLYGLAFVAGWIEQIGAFAKNEAAVNVGIVTSLFMPAEAMWKRAAYLMQPPFLREFGISPFGTASAGSQAMVLYAGCYVVVALALATRWFGKRDL